MLTLQFYTKIDVRMTEFRSKYIDETENINFDMHILLRLSRMWDSKISHAK